MFKVFFGIEILSENSKLSKNVDDSNIRIIKYVTPDQYERISDLKIVPDTMAVLDKLLEEDPNFLRRMMADYPEFKEKLDAIIEDQGMEN